MSGDGSHAVRVMLDLESGFARLAAAFQDAQFKLLDYCQEIAPDDCPSASWEVEREHFLRRLGVEHGDDGLETR